MNGETPTAAPAPSPSPAPEAPKPNADQPVVSPGANIGFGGAPGLTPEFVGKVKEFLASDRPEEEKRRVVDAIKARYLKPATVPGGVGEPVTESQLAPIGPAGALEAAKPGAGITRAIVAATPAVASMAAPLAVPEVVGAGMALRVGLAVARSLAASTAGVGAQVGVRRLAGLTPPTGTEMTLEALSSLGPQLLDEAVQPILMTGRDALRLEEAVKGKRVTLRTEQDLVRQARIRSEASKDVLRTAKGEVPPGSIIDLDSQAAAELTNLPTTLAGGKSSPHRLGTTAQADMLRGWKHTEAKKRALYGAEVTEGQRLGLRRAAPPSMIDDVNNVLDTLETSGIPEAQSKAARKILEGFRERITPKFDTDKGIVHAPVSLGYAEWDAIRRDLQKYVRTPSGSARSFEKGTIERLYAGVHDTMNDMARGTSVEGLARKADLFFQHQVVPVRDAINAGVFNMKQPSNVVRMLTASGNADRLVKVMKLVPEETADKLRAAVQEDLIKKSITPDGRLNTYKYLEKWDSFSPTQKRALSGAPGSLVEETIANTRTLLNRTTVSKTQTERHVKAALEDFTRQRAQLRAAQERAEGARGALTAAEAELQAKASTRLAKLESVVNMGAAGVGLYELAKGNVLTGMGLMLGTSVGHRAFSVILSSKKAAHTYNKMIALAGRVPPRSPVLVKLAGNLIGHLGTALYTNAIDRENEQREAQVAETP